MRRALALIAVSLAVLVAASPAAAAAGTWTDQVKFELHAGGFLVSARTDASDEPKLELSLYRHGEAAIYEVPAEITEDEVKARFGKLGELDYTFTPAEHAGPCAELFNGTYHGTFDFTGENGYVSFEADHAAGTLLGPPKDCKGAGPRRSPAAARPVVAEDEGADAREATLLAVTGHKLPLRLFFAVQFDDEEGHPRVFYTAFQEERKEGMLVARGDQIAAAPSTFTWNLVAGTAHLDPPAPFSGAAVYKRRPGGRAVWRGSLQAPVLGGRPMRPTAAAFGARLAEGSPFD